MRAVLAHQPQKRGTTHATAHTNARGECKKTPFIAEPECFGQHTRTRHRERQHNTRKSRRRAWVPRVTPGNCEHTPQQEGGSHTKTASDTCSPRDTSHPQTETAMVLQPATQPTRETTVTNTRRNRETILAQQESWPCISCRTSKRNSWSLRLAKLF